MYVSSITRTILWTVQRLEGIAARGRPDNIRAIRIFNNVQGQIRAGADPTRRRLDRILPLVKASLLRSITCMTECISEIKDRI